MVNPNSPPSMHALGVLDTLESAPRPRQEVNFTVSDKLEQYGLIELVELPSPYKAHRYEKTGRRVRHMVITDLGRAKLKEMKRG